MAGEATWERLLGTYGNNAAAHRGDQYRYDKVEVGSRIPNHGQQQIRDPRANVQGWSCFTDEEFCPGSSASLSRRIRPTR
jgi:hypothetical protein